MKNKLHIFGCSHSTGIHCDDIKAPWWKDYIQEAFNLDVFRRQGKVHTVSEGGRSVDEVYSDVSTCIRKCIEKEITEITKKLIRCADEKDWATYRYFTDEACTCVGIVNEGELFEDGGLLGFSACENGDAVLSKIDSPIVQVNGKMCVVSYTRRIGNEAYKESRVWSNHQGRWLQVHYHRSSGLGEVGSSSTAEKMQEMFRLSM